MAGMDLPIRAIREQVACAVDLIVHQARFKDGTRRITHVTEVVGMEGDVITLQDLFLFDFQVGPGRARPLPRARCGPRVCGRAFIGKLAGQRGTHVRPDLFGFEAVR